MLATRRQQCYWYFTHIVMNAAVNCIFVLHYARSDCHKDNGSCYCVQTVNSILHHAFPQRCDLLFGYYYHGEPVTAPGELPS